MDDRVCSKGPFIGAFIENLRKEAFIETAKKSELVPYLTDANTHISELAKQRFREAKI